MDGLVQKLLQVSDPEHKEYRKYLSKEQVDQYVKPLDESIKAVSDWLAESGIHKDAISTSSSKDYFKISLNVSQAEALLDTTFSTFSKKSVKVVRATSYSLPESVYSHIDFVQPTTMFPTVIKKQMPVQPIISTPESDLASCGYSITPDCLRKYYNMTYTPKSSKTILGVTGYTFIYTIIHLNN